MSSCNQVGVGVGAEVIPFPTLRKPIVPPVTTKIRVVGAPLFLRLSNPKSTPGLRALDIMLSTQLVRLTPMQTRALLFIKDQALQFDISDDEHRRYFTVERRANSLYFRWHYEHLGQVRQHPYECVVAVDAFSQKAAQLLENPVSRINWADLR
jgi:hypothetical protein